ncbi:NUDIX hydrolase [Celerinatantimonas sp. YJH-8]|uniref:NUDIX hydrolase n=1 Tax=Celerinatantimonas sp. YJH-8 TaxID=3228714 RepID=UPI0038C081F1
MAIEKLFGWHRFEVLKQKQRHPDGVERDVTWLKHPGAVVIVPIDAQGDLVLERQYRAAVSQWLLEFPAGTMEEGEDPLLCAQRELAEEVGLKAQQWQFLGTLLPAPGFCNEVQHVFVARELSSVPKHQDEDEIIEMLSLHPETMKQQIISGEINDTKTITAFYQAQLRDLI